jgi:hypothetical protein
VTEQERIERGKSFYRKISWSILFLEAEKEPDQPAKQQREIAPRPKPEADDASTP